jgi:hypothetical protein
MLIRVNWTLAGCCRRRRSGDAGEPAEEAVSGHLDTLVQATPAARRWQRLARHLWRLRQRQEPLGAARPRGAERQELLGATARQWRRLVRHLRRLRQRQRLFGYLGQELQVYPDSLRRRLRLVDPTDYQRRHGIGRR